MKKVIIIDDRQDRKRRHLSEESLDELYGLVENGMLTISVEISESIDNLHNELMGYDLIAVHRSYLTNNGIFNDVTDFINKHNKYLIVFSGGISQNTMLCKGHQLNINSKDFYTPKLSYFIKYFCSNDMQSPLLELLYGNSWRLTLLLQYRYLIWNYDDVDDIDDKKDANLAEKLQTALWGECYTKSLDGINKEIEQEKERRANS